MKKLNHLLKKLHHKIDSASKCNCSNCGESPKNSPGNSPKSHFINSYTKSFF